MVTFELFPSSKCKYFHFFPFLFQHYIVPDGFSCFILLKVLLNEVLALLLMQNHHFLEVSL